MFTYCAQKVAHGFELLKTNLGIYFVKNIHTKKFMRYFTTDSVLYLSQIFSGTL